VGGVEVRHLLRFVTFAALSLVTGVGLWVLTIAVTYPLEGGEDCTAHGHCSPIGDFMFNTGYLPPVTFLLVAVALVWWTRWNPLR
jgi:hypothetical protein